MGLSSGTVAPVDAVRPSGASLTAVHRNSATVISRPARVDAMTQGQSASEGRRPDFVYLVLYRIRTLTEDEKRQWMKEWTEIRRTLPEGMRIVMEAGNAFGTDFTGFTLYEGPIDKFTELCDLLDRRTGRLIEKTMTIIGTKGLMMPMSHVERIVEHRPVD